MAGEAINVGQNGQATALDVQKQTKVHAGSHVFDWATGSKSKVERGVSQANVDRAFQAQQAALSRQFQERLSSSAYQRAMEDMKKAGLNPALMYGGAKSASTPGGAQASGGRSAQSGETGQNIISSVLALAGVIATKGMSLAATSAKASHLAANAATVAKATATPAQAKAVSDLYNRMR